MTAALQREDLVDGHCPQEEEELDEMEVEYIEVNIQNVFRHGYRKEIPFEGIFVKRINNFHVDKFFMLKVISVVPLSFVKF